MSHAKKAAIFNKDEARTDWHDASLWMVRKRGILPLQKFQSGNF